MPMLIPNARVITHNCKSIHDAFQYQPEVLDENEQVLWRGTVITFCEDRALQIAQDAVDVLRYERMHQLTLELMPARTSR